MYTLKSENVNIKNKLQFNTLRQNFGNNQFYFIPIMRSCVKCPTIKFVMTVQIHNEYQ